MPHTLSELFDQQQWRQDGGLLTLQSICSQPQILNFRSADHCKPATEDFSDGI